MTAPWLSKTSSTDVQTAIQSQVIQTASERNTSALSNEAYDSYLTNAPIPRAYFNPTTTTTLVNNTPTTINWVNADIVFDQYRMFIGSNTFQLPIDGFYSIDAAAGYLATVGVGAYPAYAAILSGTSKSRSLNSIIKANELTITNIATAPNIIIPVSTVKPFNAGDQFYLVGYQISSADAVMTPADDAFGLSITWLAPYTEQGGS